jgi:uncharacterized protein involved in exopolysaccharide biosynthesis
VNSREVAVMIVDKLNLAAAKPAKGGPIHVLTRALSSTYSHLKAWLTYGEYVTLPQREKAIQAVQSSVSAIDLAPASGPDTGQSDSFILEVAAIGTTAVQAQQIANAAAQALSTISQERFNQDSQSYAKALSTQLSDANATLASDNQAVSNYEAAHNITAGDVQVVQALQDAGNLSSEVVSANAAVQGDQQTVSSLESTLASTTPTETSSLNITTGRSSTGDDTTEANPVYQSIQEQLSQAKATLASDTAKASSLQSQLGNSPNSSLTQDQAKLLDLEEQVTADQSSVQTLSSAVQQANANIQVAPVELSQLGGANLPAYPSSPKRDLYLILGLLLGGAAGTALTYQAQRRRAQVQPYLNPSGQFEILTPNEPSFDEPTIKVHVGSPPSSGETSVLKTQNNGSQPA